MSDNYSFTLRPQAGKGKDSLEVNAAIMRALSSLAFDRAQLAVRLGRQYGGDRKLQDVLGYKNAPLFEDYLALYRRGDIAKRIVDAFPAATWRNPPTLAEGEKKRSAFVKAWESLTSRVDLMTGKSLNVWGMLERADRLARIGRYGVLVLGFRGRYDFSEPVKANQYRGNPDGLVYLSAFGEGSVKIKDADLDSDPASPRFGLPEFYTIDFSDSVANFAKIGEKKVHWTRVIHIAEGLLEDEIYGTPALEPILNRLDDLQKVVGGSAEMFWLGARNGMVAQVKDDYSLAGDSKAQEKVLSDLQDFSNGLRRFLVAEGYEPKNLGTQVATPKDHIEAIVTILAATAGIPKRILLGNEAGDLASSQDEVQWDKTVAERSVHHAEANILLPFVRRLQWAGVLPQTAQGVVAHWPLVESVKARVEALGMEQKAKTGLVKAQAARAFVGPTGKPIMALQDPLFREEIWGVQELDPARLAMAQESLLAQDEEVGNADGQPPTDQNQPR